MHSHQCVAIFTCSISVPNFCWLASLEVAVDPVTFPGLAIVSDPLASAVPQAFVEEAPVHAFVAYKAAPSVVDVVLELAFV